MADTLTTTPATTASAEANASTGVPAGEAKENVFTQLFGHLGNHHSIDFEPIGKLELPYLFFDKGAFHAYPNSESLLSTGQYTVDLSKESSPIGEKSGVLRKDGSHVSLDLSITANLVFFTFAAILVTIILRIAAMGAKKSLVPKGIRNMVEVLIVFVRDDIIAPNIAEPYGERLLPYFLSVFFLLMTVNLVGLLPWAHTATSSLEITAALSVFSFAITQYVGIKSMGVKNFFLHLTGGLHEMELSVFMKIFLLLIMVPIEIMGLFTKPFALAIRLFANMSAGHIVIFSLIGLTFLFHSVFVGAFVSVPFALFVYLLEIFVAVLQAYIFTTLSAVFIGMMAHSAHDEHVHDHDMPHAPSGDHVVATAHTV